MNEFEEDMELQEIIDWELEREALAWEECEKEEA